MKRVLTITGILLIILICSVLGIQHISKTNLQMNQYLENTISYLSSENYTQALEEIESAKKLWEKSGSFINTYVNHETVDVIEENLVRLSANIHNRQATPSLVLIEAIQFELNHIYECELPTLKNIF
ncbi:Uncharacterised protein [uncultured Ruminococcus sp.]|uniref:DUF4363 family protein n=1 Tax=Massiliimalia timonensis TaxID=1987501 RepID=A0A8J6P6I5_9FIRM|nr:DUF4363 family protein [Massiliimalia timonensis]MBC8610155.1 DUF4363 family protein [Massiliimalia timonensis]MBS7175820.1 DUF4363 family protein [Clostridiales bacterium]SCH07310.1 Uncharacterised protein [uncultured Ruminococcus sp.]SCH76524.1 Uncharacterised protein [uncultured Clostridium sp.]